MSKVAFLLYYSGYAGLLFAYFLKEIWLDRISLISLLFGCFTYARIWKSHIESAPYNASSLVEALNLLNKHQLGMDWFIRAMPNLFSDHAMAEKNEYRYIREKSKTLAQAIRSHFNNPWEMAPVAMCAIIPTWLYGISNFNYERYYRMSPLFHDLMVHGMVAVFTYYLSIGLTRLFLYHSLRK
jgi:hypothetical protein